VTTQAIDTLPVKDGFRQRGLEMTRIETFVDAAFAFALTMLVLSSFPPKTFGQLQDMMRDIPVFVFGAANLMIFWHGHNEWSRRFGLDDFATMLLSVGLVSTILIYVYPLRFVGNLFIGFLGRVTHLPLGHLPEGEFRSEDVNSAFVIYGAGFIANGLVLILLNRHAWKKRGELQLNADERHCTLAEIGAWSILCAVGLISVIVGIALPRVPGAPGMTYMLLPILMPIYGAMMKRRRARVIADRTPSHEELLQALGAKDI
jgi:hypothetical protein